MNKDLISSKALTHDTLPDAQSRVEHYLDYLCGRATDLAALPEPKSRVEHFLEYLCYHGMGAGGGATNPNCIIDAQLNGDILTLVRDNGSTQEIDLSQLNFVKEWQDLEYATQSNHFNIFNPSTFEHGIFYNSIGYPERGDDWGNFRIVCNAGDTFTLFKKAHDSMNLALFDDNRWVQNLKVNRNNDNGWVKYIINIPQGIQVNNISIPVHKTTNNYKNEVMIFRGNVNAPNKYIPFTNNRVVSIDGENVAITFDSSNTSLTSSTAVDAIKELDNKVVTINNSVGVMQSELDGKVDITELSTTSQANKVPQLKADGKLDISMLPDMSINSVHVVNTKDEALNLINNNTAGIGDVFIIKNPSNDVYMYVNEAGLDFDGKCVELTMSDGTVKSVNGVYANDLGEVEIAIDDIENLMDHLEYFENDKASLNKNNVFIGNNTFNELTLMGKNTFAETNRTAEATNGHSPGIYCGYRPVSTGTSPKYVSAIKIKIANNYAIGDMIDNVYITAVQKSANKADDIIRETVCNGKSFIVEEDNIYGKCIYVPVQKTYTNDTYFLVGKKGNRALSECRYIYDLEKAEAINSLNIDNIPPAGNTLGISTPGNGWIIIHSLVSDNINVREELNKSVKIWTDLDHVELNAGKIEVDGDEVSVKFDKGQTSLVSTDVVSAVKELSNKVDNVGAGTPPVTSVNGKQGDVVLNGTHIEATLSGATKTVQTHLQEIGTGVSNIDTRLSNLQTKKPQVHVGEIISTFKNHGSSYALNGVTYLYCGTNTVISSSAYPELTNALGLSGVSNYSLPIINDITIKYDNAVRTAVRKHYICAKIS